MSSNYAFTNTMSEDAGGDDHVVPASVDRSAATHSAKSTATTDYREFPGRSHFTLGQDGWEEIADYALDRACAAVSASRAPSLVDV